MQLAISMSNTGGAWDIKSYLEDMKSKDKKKYDAIMAGEEGIVTGANALLYYVGGPTYQCAGCPPISGRAACQIQIEPGAHDTSKCAGMDWASLSYGTFRRGSDGQCRCGKAEGDHLTRHKFCFVLCCNCWVSEFLEGALFAESACEQSKQGGRQKNTQPFLASATIRSVERRKVTTMAQITYAWILRKLLQLFGRLKI